MARMDAVRMSAVTAVYNGRRAVAAFSSCRRAVAAMEFAGDDIVVNMVCPDAVFGCGDNPSGLWQEIGPDRARAKGLDADALEAHYRDRNMLKSLILAQDVGRAVLFFAARRTPTTGCLITVDGGVPGGFPR